MKYFLYISTLKVSMLFDQIPLSIKKRVAAELKIDLKVLSATFKGVNTSETTISKLQLVIKCLESENEIGDLWNPKDYFAGEAKMGWGALEYDEAINDEPKEGMVIFGGLREDMLPIGLIGSRAHMLGEVGRSVHAAYTFPSFVRKVADGIRFERDKDILTEPSGRGILFTVGKLIVGKEDVERVEFVAKTFSLDKSLLLGSPLYVALSKKEREKELFSQFLSP